MDDQSSIRTDYWDKEMASGSAGGGQSGGSSVDVDGEVRSERKGDGDAGLRETKNVMTEAVKAVQWGKLESLKRMVEANQVRVNDSDDQNCSVRFPLVLILFFFFAFPFPILGTI